MTALRFKKRVGATTLSLAQTEDKVLAAFSAGGVFVYAEQFLAGSPDPKWQAIGAFLVAVGVLLKAIISSTPQTPAQVVYVKNPDGTFSPK
jgi:hypothetical protein